MIVNFFASWCPPCKEEAPELARAARRLTGRVTVLGVAWKDWRSDTRRLLRRSGATYPVLNDGHGRTEASWGVAVLPETFVVGRDGHVIAHVAGRLDETELTRLIKTAENS